MPKNLENVQIYPEPAKWATFYGPNQVMILMQVNSLTLNNLHYIVLALCKAARPAQIKEKFEILGL